MIDLGFGDAGKGSITDFLVRDRAAELVVRFNGGAQAGHSVVLEDGRQHTFSQFGSGSFAGAPTLLGPDFLLHPLGMEVEARHLRAAGLSRPFATVAVHEDAKLITPYHQARNRYIERQRGASAHGSCGVGVGECVQHSFEAPDEVLRAGDLCNPTKIRRRLHLQRQRAIPDPLFTDDTLIERVIQAWGELAEQLSVISSEQFGNRLAQAKRVVFEGAQGVLLDQWWGLHPHTTWSDCTGGAIATLWNGDLTRLGLVRSYMVRHGRGPLPTEGSGPDVQEIHNSNDSFQGRFRTGALDAVLLRYALKVCPTDVLVVSHIDQQSTGRVCPRYQSGQEIGVGAREDLDERATLTRRLFGEQPVLESADVVPWVEEQLSLPVGLTSVGSAAADKTWR